MAKKKKKQKFYEAITPEGSQPVVRYLIRTTDKKSAHGIAQLTGLNPMQRYEISRVKLPKNSVVSESVTSERTITKPKSQEDKHENY